MILVKQIAGVFVITNDKTREIIEAFDTKYEAEEAYEPYRQQACLEEFDRKRRWESLWDIENQ